LERELGRGGMAAVYLARDLRHDRLVALKVLHPELAHALGPERFVQEIRLAARLDHPHILSVYDSGETAGQLWFTMPFVDGESLRQRLTREPQLPLLEALRITRAVADALGYAQRQGIIHRDVKPENVLLARREGDQSGFPFQAKLVDLGLARPQRLGTDMNLTAQGQVMGTPTTMAPEQFDDPEGVDFRADIYGLGCVLFHALTGRPAFAGRTLAQIVTAKVSGMAPNPSAEVAGLSPEIGMLVAAMLAKDKEARPQSYADLMARCDRIAGGGKAASSTTLPWLVIGGFGVAAAVLLVLLVANRPSPSPAPSPSPVEASTATLPTTAPAVSAAFGQPQGLWRLDLVNRLKDWRFDAGAGWQASEAEANGIAGVSGRISRPLDPGAWIIDARLVPGNGEEAKTDEIRLGVELADGGMVFVKLANLGSAALLTVEKTFADPAAASEIIDKSQSPPGPLRLELTYAERFLRIAHDGTPFERAIGLPGDPVRLFLATEGEAPVEVTELTIRRP
jgi:serine/threonine protein kinase